MFLPIFVVLGAAARADQLVYLDRSELALAKLYTDIAGATDTIDLTYLMWDPCSSASKVLMKKLREKTRGTAQSPRPVKVRMLIDSFFQYRDVSAMARYFSENGIEARFFNPTDSPLKGNHRTHSKLALVDRKLAGKARMITGGRNITDDYFGMGQRNYVDRDVAVQASSAAGGGRGAIAQAEEGFEKLWSHPMSKRLRPASEEGMRRLRACTKWTARDAKLEKYLESNAAGLLSGEPEFSCPDTRFTMDGMAHVNRPGSAKFEEDGSVSFPEPESILPHKPTTAAVIDLFRGARRSLTLENQYYIPDDAFLRPLMRGLRGRVNVDLYSNMFDDSSSPVVLWHSHHMRRGRSATQRNHSNFRIAGLMDRWEFTPPRATYSYHSKVFVADGKDAIVSSFNIDPRSAHINGESALIARNCLAFAAKVEGITRLTGKLWTMEENYQVQCLGQERPRPSRLDPLQTMLQFFTKDLQ